MKTTTIGIVAALAILSQTAFAKGRRPGREPIYYTYNFSNTANVPIQVSFYDKAPKGLRWDHRYEPVIVHPPDAETEDPDDVNSLIVDLAYSKDRRAVKAKRLRIPPGASSLTVRTRPARTAGIINNDATITFSDGHKLSMTATGRIAFNTPEPPCTVILDARALNDDIKSVVDSALNLGVNKSWLINKQSPVTVGNPWLNWSRFHAKKETALLPKPDEDLGGWFQLPDSPPFSIERYVQGGVPQSQLTDVDGVLSLTADHLEDLVGRRVIAVVYDGEITTDEDKDETDLRGARLGRLACTILEIKKSGIRIRIESPVSEEEIPEPCCFGDFPDDDNDQDENGRDDGEGGGQALDHEEDDDDEKDADRDDD